MSLANSLFETRHLLEGNALMNYPEDPCLDAKEYSEIELKTNDKIMCRNMVRKDFELIRIQDSFLKLFNDAEFFSQDNDDLLSVGHVAQIAFKKTEYQIHMAFYDIIRDFGYQLAFHYKNGEKPELENIRDNAAAFVNLVFQSSTFDCEQQATKYFLEEMIKNYQDFDLVQAKACLQAINIELKEQE